MNFRVYDSETRTWPKLVALKMHHLYDGVPQTAVIQNAKGDEEEWVLGGRFQFVLDYGCACREDIVDGLRVEKRCDAHKGDPGF